jgi:16S rRNA (guanine966-N2)-methyltransferase
MRIINGKYRGKRIQAPKKLSARPTTDFAKEALFNILDNRFDLEGLFVLDLFAGTGNIGFEFASRGAERVTAVDIERQSNLFVSKTAKELDLPVRTIKNDVFRFLNTHGNQYDIIFADPPYGMENTANIARLVFENKVLKDEGWLIIEHDERTNLKKVEHFLEHRKYGKVNFSFFSW